jgi:3-oxoacyl-[acyl-carrier-protein] synthase II
MAEKGFSNGWRHAGSASGDYRDDMGNAPRVVVTGMGAVTAFGRGVDAFWNGALSGRSAIRPVTRFDTGRFHARQAALIDLDDEAGGADLETLFARDAVREALASCPLFGGGLAGVAIGTTLAGNGALTEWLASRAGGAERLSRSEPGALARDLAVRHGARGPVGAVSLACASGTAAVGLAAEWIREGRAVQVLAGGADAVTPFVFSGFDALRALSASVARPFDVARDGLTLGEGAGFLLLEEEGHARRRGAAILARVVGYGSGSDAHHMTRPDPGGRGLIRAIEAALLQAGRISSDVDFVSAHGTGTTFNDAMEEAALAHVLGGKAHTVPVNGIKGAIGHTLGAAGALEAILSVLVLTRQRVPPTAGHASSRADSPLAVVSSAPLTPERPLAVALSTSSAFGGTNAALVLEGA